MCETTVQTEFDLSGFHGTENWYKNTFGLLYTDGIAYLAEEAGAYWLIDLVDSYQPKFKDVPFQLWKIELVGDNSAIVTMRKDTDEPSLIMQKVEYTDFPLSELEFYCIDNVMLLKSEY